MKQYYAHILKPQNNLLGVVNSELNKDQIYSVKVTEEKATELKQLLSQRKTVKYIDKKFVVQTRSITKRELVDKLIAMNKASEFNLLLNALPLAEKLRWEASPMIAPDYPFIVDERLAIVTALQITEDQLDSIFQ